VALLAVAALRLPPAASRPDGARPRPGAFPHDPRAEGARRCPLDGVRVQARIVKASQGARWLGEGWQLFRVSPLAWLALACAYLLGTNILALVPVIGFVAALVIVPALTVGMMSAARAASHGATPSLRMLGDGFRSGAGVQLGLGGVYFACSM